MLQIESRNPSMVVHPGEIDDWALTALGLPEMVLFIPQYSTLPATYVHAISASKEFVVL